MGFSKRNVERLVRLNANTGSTTRYVYSVGGYNTNTNNGGSTGGGGGSTSDPIDTKNFVNLTEEQKISANKVFSKNVIVGNANDDDSSTAEAGKYKWNDGSAGCIYFNEEVNGIVISPAIYRADVSGNLYQLMDSSSGSFVDLDSDQTITGNKAISNKLYFGNPTKDASSRFIDGSTWGYLKYDASTNSLHSSLPIYSDAWITAKGVGTIHDLSMSPIQFVYGYDDLSENFSDEDKDETFNAYTIKKLGERITTLEELTPESYFEYDETHDALRCIKPLYSESWITAGGVRDASGSLVDGSIHVVYDWDDLGDYIPRDSSSCFNAYTTNRLYQMIQDISTGGGDVTYEAVVEALGYIPYDDATNWDNDTSTFLTPQKVKTINNQSIVGSGNITIDASVSASDISTALGYQPLGPNSIKTINSQSLIGSGDITIDASITAQKITTALGYTPYDKDRNWAIDTSTFLTSRDASSFVTKVKTLNGTSLTGTGDVKLKEIMTFNDVSTALGYTPYDKARYWATDTSAFLTSRDTSTFISSVKTLNGTSLVGTGNVRLKDIMTFNDVSTALGYTPYDKARYWATDTSTFLEASDLPTSLNYFTYDASADALKCTKPLYSTGWITAGGIEPVQNIQMGLVQFMYGYGDLDNHTFYDSDKDDTFNAYTIQKLHQRIYAIENEPENPILQYFEYDTYNDAVRVTKPMYSNGWLSAQGVSEAEDLQQGKIQFVYDSSSLGGSFSDEDTDDTFNAYTINNINDRLVVLENQSPETSYFEYDETHDAVRCLKPIYSESWITAGGIHDASGSLVDGSIHVVYDWNDIEDNIPRDSSSCFNAYTTKKLYDMIQNSEVTYESVVQALGYVPYDNSTNWADDTSAFITVNNVKTINNQSIVGSGNITIDASVTAANITAALGYLPLEPTKSAVCGALGYIPSKAKITDLYGASTSTLRSIYTNFNTYTDVIFGYTDQINGIKYVFNYATYNNNRLYFTAAYFDPFTSTMEHITAYITSTGTLVVE